MKTVIRNFYSILNRFRMATTLNIIGLSVAFATFLLLTMQVLHEERFDSCYPTAKRLFLVKMNNARDGSSSIIFPGAFQNAVTQSSPHILSGAMYMPYGDKSYISVEDNGAKRGFREQILLCNKDLTKVFGFHFVAGDPNSLSDPEKLIIPESMAKRMFGGKSAIGQRIHAEQRIWFKGYNDMTVGAVYRDFPENAQLDNYIYSQIDMNDQNVNSWDAFNYFCILLLDDAASQKAVTDNINRTFDFKPLMWDDKDKLSVELIPMTDLHYMTHISDIWGASQLKTGSVETTRLLFYIAVLILIVAAINYMNFSTALTPMRIRSINTQKVLGSSNGQLRFSLLVEAACISIIAYVLSLFLIYVLNQAGWLSFITSNIDMMANLPLLAWTAVIALLVGLAAGVYPAYYMTSFSPAMVLKGSFGLSPSGRKLRTALISFQYIISVGLIVGACIVQLQDRYMRHFKLGFDKDKIAIVELSDSIYRGHKDAYVNQLLKYPEVESVAFSMQLPGSSDEYARGDFNYRGEKFNSEYMFVSPTFFRVMGIPITEGSDFTASMEKDTSTTYMICNEILHKSTSVKVGEDVSQGYLSGKMLGFANNINTSSLRLNVGNMTYILANQNMGYTCLDFSLIRLRAGYNAETAVRHIREVVAGLDPAYPVDVKFYDDVFNDLYQHEEFVKKTVTVASFLAILISIVGVFGLVIFETQYRRKEIGIRKINGATVKDILLMFNRKYFYIVVGSFVVAAPIAYWAADKWLQNFAYKVSIPWWIFALAFVIVLTVTLLTVSFQNWRTANENPVKSIRCE